MKHVLYILMRSDMTSMNPGKAIAQGSHATNMFEQRILPLLEHGPIRKAVEEWRGDRGFGTCVTLNVYDEEQLLALVTEAQSEGYSAGVVHDPTYPVRDGHVTHLLPVNTCGYIFFHSVATDHDRHSMIRRRLLKLKLYD